MRRLLAVLLAALILTGCASSPAPTTIPTETTAATEIPETTQETVPETVPASEPPAFSEPEDGVFVRVTDYIPDIAVDLRYATAHNFTHAPVYAFTDAFLRYGTVKKLAEVQDLLREAGYSLKIWDAFRPVDAQFVLWNRCPDGRYVADPNRGYSSHSRGNTLDVTLVRLDGSPLEMPSDFDDFTALGDRDYSDCSLEAMHNVQLLETTMEAHGFRGYEAEWWHFSDTDSWEPAEDFVPTAPALRRTQGDLALQAGPADTAPALARMPAGTEILCLARQGPFALAQWEGVTGWVPIVFTRPCDSKDFWVADCEEYLNLRTAPGSPDSFHRIPDGDALRFLGWEGRYARVEHCGSVGYVMSGYLRPADPDYFENLLSIVTPTDTYPYESLLEDLEALEQAYPQWVRVESAGLSEEGREIPVLILGDPEAPRQILLQGGIHGREYAGSWLLMALAEDALRTRSFDPAQTAFHILPMVNPDGVTVSQTGILGNPDGTGDADAETARTWQANACGIDLNRNFPTGWEDLPDSPPGPEHCKGSQALSAAETQALADYTLHHDFLATVSYHAGNSRIYWAFEEPIPETRSLAEALSRVTGYPLKEARLGGGYRDWADRELGIPSLTLEVGCQEAPLPRRELFSIFARNRQVLPALALWEP